VQRRSFSTLWDRSHRSLSHFQIYGFQILNQQPTSFSLVRSDVTIQFEVEEGRNALVCLLWVHGKPGNSELFTSISCVYRHYGGRGLALDRLDPIRSQSDAGLKRQLFDYLEMILYLEPEFARWTNFEKVATLYFAKMWPWEFDLWPWAKPIERRDKNGI